MGMYILTLIGSALIFTTCVIVVVRDARERVSKSKDKERKLLEDYERYLDNRILGKHNSRASKQLIDDYFENRNNT